MLNFHNANQLMFRIVKLINDFDWNTFVLCDKNVIYIYLLFDALWNIKII